MFPQTPGSLWIVLVFIGKGPNGAAIGVLQKLVWKSILSDDTCILSPLSVPETRLLKKKDHLK